MKKLGSIILSGLILIFPVVTVAASPKLDQVGQVNGVFDRLVQAYMQEDMKLFLELHHNPIIGADMDNKTTFIFTHDQLVKEMKFTFDHFSGIQVRFDERRIEVLGDTAYVTTVRMFTADGLPEYHVRLAFALKRPFPIWGQRWKWEITDQVMVEEWVVEKANLCASGLTAKPQDRRSLFW